MTPSPRPQRIQAGSRSFLLVNGVRIPSNPPPSQIPDLLPAEIARRLLRP